MKHTDYLKKKKNREIRRRVISVLSALVVFVATYALVLPALTLDVKTARMEPGMSVQQEADPEAVTAPEAPAEEETVEESTKEEEPAEAVEPEKEEKSVKEESAKEDQSAQAEEQAPAEDASKDKADEATQKEDAGQADADSAAADQAPAKNDSSSEAVDQSGADAAEENTKEAAAEAFKVPELEAIDFNEILTDKTDFYYYHADKDEDAAAVSSTDIDDWKKVTEDPVLAPEDFVRVYLAYSIPAGALNETNATTTYRLPEGLELTDKQIKAINKNENGISGTDKDAKDYKKYLGAEAIEGTRTPDKTRSDDEYISATVKVEKVYENDKYVGQDLVFTFAPYTVQKNQISYDDEGNIKSEGKAVKGWFTFDLTPSRIGFEETEDAAAESSLVRSEAKITFVKENNKKDIDEISRALTLDAPAGTDADKTEEKAEQAAEQKSLTFEGADYTVVINYTEDAQIPDNAELAVSEIEKGTDEYNDYLKQAEDAVDEDKTVNEARFFDITILADGEKVEPAAPVSVQINFAGIEQTKAEDAQLLHYTEDEVQVMDKAEFGKSEEPENEAKPVDTVQFETDGFSVYGIVIIDKGEGSFVFEDENCIVTVTYTKEADIPAGTKMSVSEIDQESDEYARLFSDAWSKLNEEYLQKQNPTKGESSDIENAENKDPIYLKNVLEARFFDISFDNNGEKFEPKSGVDVNVRLKKGLDNPDDSNVAVVHFKESEANIGAQVELFEDVEVTQKDNTASEFKFTQDSFSIDGFITTLDAKETLKAKRALRANGTNGVELDPPQASKTLDDLEDGTYKLSLNVAGSSKSEESDIVNKQNVIIIVDESTSMRFGEYTQVGTAQNGVPQGFEPQADVAYYYSNVTTRVSNALSYNSRRNRFTRDGENYTGPVYTFKSRIDNEDEALEALIHSLMSKNHPGETTPDGISLDDIIEVRMIGFNTGSWYLGDGWSHDEQTLLSYIPREEDLGYHTHWEAATSLAKEAAIAIRDEQPDEDVHVIFLTDGEPEPNNTQYEPAKRNARDIVNLVDEDGTKYAHLYDIFTYGDLQTVNPKYPEMLDNSDAWGMRPNPTKMKILTNFAYTNGQNDTDSDTEYTEKYFFDAKTVDQMMSAFENVFSQITNSLAYGRVSITDGMSVDATATTIVDGKADGFTYTVTGKTGGELYRVTATGNDQNPSVIFTVSGRTYNGEKRTGSDGKTYYGADVAGTEYKMALASIDNTGKITWDLGGIGTLLDGYTYSCNFDVWPNQDAYDYVADLNNGLVQWDASIAEEVLNKDGTIKYWKGGVVKYPSIVKLPDDKGFSVLTNTDQTLTYSYVNTTTIDGVPTTTYDGPYTMDLDIPDPMDLKTEKMKVVKNWDHSINSASIAEKVTFKLKKDGKYYQKDGTLSDAFDRDTSWILEVTKENTQQKPNWVKWTDEFGIAPGLLKTLTDGGYELKDEGHEYTVEEYEITGGNYANYNYDFSAPVVRPMVVGKVLKYLIKVDDDHPVPNKSSVEVYTIKGIGTEETFRYYYDPDLDDVAGLTAVNYKTSELDITKLIAIDGEVPVVDGSLKESTLLDGETFTYKITLSVPSDSDPCGITAHEYVPRLKDQWNGSSRIYIYGYQNDDGSTTYDPDTTRFINKVYGRFNSQIYTLLAKTKVETRIVDGQERSIVVADLDSNGKIQWIAPEDPSNPGFHTVTFYMTLNRNEVIRIANLPKGTKYTVQEVAANVCTANDSNNYPIPITSISKEGNVADEGYKITKVEHTNGTLSTTTIANDTISGEIDKYNTRYYNQFTNDIKPLKIQIKKIGDWIPETTLGGVQFKLFSDEECTKQILQDAIGTAIGDENGILTTLDDGTIDIGKLIAGTYYLKEIKSADGYELLSELIEFTIDKNGEIVYTTGNQNFDLSIHSTYDLQDGGKGLYINNPSGAKLPMTGGPGTTLYTLGGFCLIMASALMYGFRMRRRERRLN